MDNSMLTDAIISKLNDYKAKDITNIDVSELTDVVSNMVICTATSRRHAHTLADKLLQELKKQDGLTLYHEGMDEKSWILIDCFDVVVHIMLEETRAYYDLEKLLQTTEAIRQQ